ncbi:MAG: class I mannose-6-phosphate isomerase [Anaerotruncus sp.]|nr:MAG: class I mannose-6-phosphate isomerase [Anaerotruncus sp.]
MHPDNEYAARVEHEFGKTEMWYVLDAAPGATLIYGFKNKIGKEEFKQAIESNTLLDVLNVVEVKKGDMFFIEAGTVHAIGKGALIAEIQQNSNSTYRVYDYGRLGKRRKNRASFTFKKAIDVSKTEPAKYGTKPFGKKGRNFRRHTPNADRMPTFQRI